MRKRQWRTHVAVRIELNETESSREFAAFVDPHLPALRRFAVTLIARDDVDDLVQDTLVRAWKKWEQYDAQRGQPTSWLLAIAADRARRYWVRRLPDLDLAHAPARTTEISEFIDLRRAIRKLPIRQRQAIVLFHYVDLDIAGVATLMHCSQGTVKSTLSDARKSLRQMLGETDEEH
jgi:RNA polymerase sigma factor (sigma-70 family)